MPHRKNSHGYRTAKTKVKELPLYGKFFLLFGILVLIRFGSTYPLPFVNRDYMKMILSYEGLGFLNSITGGSMQQMSFFALSISPYITASIIVQLLTVVLPPLEEMQKDGKTGMEKFKKIIRYLAIALSVIQSAAMAVGLGSQGMLMTYDAKTIITAIVIWSAGSIVLIGLSSFIDWMEIGNGVSILLVSNILAAFPSDVFTVKDMFLTGRNTAYTVLNIAIIVGVLLAIIAACVVLHDSAKNIPVVNSRKLPGHVANSTFPIPLNTCSVMPVIFAGSIMSFPIVITQFMGVAKEGIPMHLIRVLTTSQWFSPENPVYTIGAVLYFGLTTFFTYFYLEIGFNSLEIADNLKRSGATIPGIRPGAPTASYIRKLSTQVALLGNTVTTLLILLMHLICNVNGIGTLGIAGTSIIILVSVVMEERKLLSSVLVTGRRKRLVWRKKNA